MSDSTGQIEPTPPVRGAEPVRPVRPAERPAGTPDQGSVPDRHSVAATTGGNLRGAYAQYVVNPDTQDVVVRIRDAATDQVLSELPSKEVQAMTAYLKNYVETLARHKTALQGGSSL
jgi:FlaG protein